ncbi:MAG: hypothetical protein ACREGA_03600 [Candidatus Saccharimonadales bacterium]
MLTKDNQNQNEENKNGDDEDGKTTIAGFSLGEIAKAPVKPPESEDEKAEESDN